MASGADEMEWKQPSSSGSEKEKEISGPPVAPESSATLYVDKGKGKAVDDPAPHGSLIPEQDSSHEAPPPISLEDAIDRENSRRDGNEKFSLDNVIATGIPKGVKNSFAEKGLTQVKEMKGKTGVTFQRIFKDLTSEKHGRGYGGVRNVWRLLVLQKYDTIADYILDHSVASNDNPASMKAQFRVLAAKDASESQNVSSALKHGLGALNVVYGEDPSITDRIRGQVCKDVFALPNLILPEDDVKKYADFAKELPKTNPINLGTKVTAFRIAIRDERLSPEDHLKYLQAASESEVRNRMQTELSNVEKAELFLGVLERYVPKCADAQEGSDTASSIVDHAVKGIEKLVNLSRLPEEKQKSFERLCKDAEQGKAGTAAPPHGAQSEGKDDPMDLEHRPKDKGKAVEDSLPEVPVSERDSELYAFPENTFAEAVEGFSGMEILQSRPVTSVREGDQKGINSGRDRLKVFLKPKAGRRTVGADLETHVNKLVRNENEFGHVRNIWSFFRYAGNTGLAGNADYAKIADQISALIVNSQNFKDEDKAEFMAVQANAVPESQDNASKDLARRFGLEGLRIVKNLNTSITERKQLKILTDVQNSCSRHDIALPSDALETLVNCVDGDQRPDVRAAACAAVVKNKNASPEQHFRCMRAMKSENVKNNLTFDEKIDFYMTALSLYQPQRRENVQRSAEATSIIELADQDIGSLLQSRMPANKRAAIETELRRLRSEEQGETGETHSLGVLPKSEASTSRAEVTAGSGPLAVSKRQRSPSDDGDHKNMGQPSSSSRDGTQGDLLDAMVAADAHRGKVASRGRGSDLGDGREARGGKGGRGGGGLGRF